MTTPETTRTTAATWVLDALRDADAPVTVAEILKRVRQRQGVRLARPTAYSALERLRLQSQVVYIDDEGQPRRWPAVPQDLR